MAAPLYETPRLLSEYLLFHYGSAEELIAHPSLPVAALDFAVRTVQEMLPAPVVGTRALDLGCAVGRSSLELSRYFPSVLGIDYSQSFVTAAERLRQGQRMAYQRHDEGHTYTPLTASAPSDLALSGVKFSQGDAMDLDPGLAGFDLVHAANLLCRLSHPTRLLARLPHLVRSGGHLILTTPCTWLEEFTPTTEWPAEATLAWLHQHLDEAFVLEYRTDLPFLIRETARKYQHTLAEATRWRRR